MTSTPQNTSAVMTLEQVIERLRKLDDGSCGDGVSFGQLLSGLRATISDLRALSTAPPSPPMGVGGVERERERCVRILQELRQRSEQNSKKARRGEGTAVGYEMACDQAIVAITGALSAPAAAPPPMSVPDESGWLVELGSDPPRWWDGRRDDSFTVDAFEAIRFSRAVDAQVAIAWLVKEGVRAGCKATEHGFGVGMGDRPKRDWPETDLDEPARCENCGYNPNEEEDREELIASAARAQGRALARHDRDAQWLAALVKEHHAWGEAASDAALCSRLDIERIANRMGLSAQFAALLSGESPAVPASTSAPGEGTEHDVQGIGHGWECKGCGRYFRDGVEAQRHEEASHYVAARSAAPSGGQMPRAWTFEEWKEARGFAAPSGGQEGDATTEGDCPDCGSYDASRGRECPHCGRLPTAPPSNLLAKLRTEVEALEPDAAIAPPPDHKCEPMFWRGFRHARFKVLAVFDQDGKS